ncbi:MAG: UDP-N-acetylmuramoyl-L-alanyl-D-glutamate--2,6-diaminopimelate ligase [Candidatus Paceibacterota bacterium]
MQEAKTAEIIMFKSKFKKLVPEFLISFYHWLWALVGALVYGFPSSYIKIIGVTGTNGKSTVVTFTRKILEEAGFKVASVSSISFQLGDEKKQNDLKMTMPGRGQLHAFLKKAIKKDCDYAIIEVTSEGIKQHRHRFINFDAAVFTNLKPEHIEAHGSFENYKHAKGKLWKQLKEDGISIINLDDKHSDYFWNFPAGVKYGYTTRKLSKDNIIKAENIELENKFPQFTVDEVNFELPVSGKFNIYNALAAISIGKTQEVDLKTCSEALKKVQKISGRMEVVIEDPFKVVVDYAHTPDALQNVYKSLGGNLICVLGSCGGGRDRWKRSVLGEIADKNCEDIILTNEDPYDEDPRRIVEDIKEGIKNKEKVKVILDREQAIEEALKRADNSNTVVITGKGSEPWMCVSNGEKIPWDDREIVKEKVNNKDS